MIMSTENPEFEARAISCTDCVWRREGGLTCDAFPDGIPEVILLGVFDHTNKYSVGAVSDDGLTKTTVEDLNNLTNV